MYPRVIAGLSKQYKTGIRKWLCCFASNIASTVRLCASQTRAKPRPPSSLVQAFGVLLCRSIYLAFCRAAQEGHRVLILNNLETKVQSDASRRRYTTTRVVIQSKQRVRYHPSLKFQALSCMSEKKYSFLQDRGTCAHRVPI